MFEVAKALPVGKLDEVAYNFTGIFPVAPVVFFRKNLTDVISDVVAGVNVCPTNPGGAPPRVFISLS